jgi:ribosomal protein L34E
MKEEEIAALDTFIGTVSKANRIESEDLQMLYYWYSKITKKHERPSGCASCIRDLIKEFRRQLGKIDKP